MTSSDTLKSAVSTADEKCPLCGMLEDGYYHKKGECDNFCPKCAKIQSEDDPNGLCPEHQEEFEELYGEPEFDDDYFWEDDYEEVNDADSSTD